MLKKIRIQGYKSFPSIELHLPRLAVLIGPNAAGKSNFLDALQLLSKLATRRTIYEAFEPPHRGKTLESFTYGADGVKGLLKQETLSFSLEGDLHLSDPTVEAVTQQIRELHHPSDYEEGASSAVQERDLRYRIAIEICPKTGMLSIIDEYLAALDEWGSPNRTRPSFLERQGQKTLLHREDQAQPKIYDSHSNRSFLSLRHYPPHYPHLTAVKHELESWQFFYFEPRERMRALYPLKEVHRIGLMGEELAPYLNTVRARDPNQFEGIEAALRALLPNVTGIDIDVNRHGEIELCLLENGVPVSANLLSEGTLRLLGLLALSGVEEIPALVGLEEPENGVHPRRIELIAELLRTKEFLKESQYIVTSHSPILPDWLDSASILVVRRTQGRTCITPLAPWHPLWTNKGQDNAGINEQEPVSTLERILRGDFDP